VVPILGFINTTEIGRRPGEVGEEEERHSRLDRWDLGRLEEEEEEERTLKKKLMKMRIRDTLIKTQEGIKAQMPR